MTVRQVLFEEGMVDVHLEPFPHVVLDGWWPDSQLALVANEFPDVADPRWHRFDNDHEQKLQGGSACWGSYTRGLLTELSEPGWRQMVGALMAIREPLSFDLEGGGMHLIPPGGHLGIHADFNRSSAGLWRRVNCLVFLNPGWEPGMGGELELRYGPGDENPTITSIPPLFNRTVLFETSDRSWHGHPNPLPGDWCRRSIAAYYFTEERPPAASDPHSTVFL